MRLRMLPLSLLTVVVLGSGCGSDDSSGSTPSVPISELPTEFAASLCTALTACYGADLDWLLGGESCQQRFETQLSDGLATIEGSIDNGTVEYSGDKLRACLDAIEAEGCQAGAASDSEVCRAALDGTIAIGAECDYSLECAGSAYCKSSGACPGVCTERQAVGATCEDDAECATGLRCAEATSRCYQPSAAGDLCGGTEGKECDAGLFCIGADDSGKAGNCRGLDEVFVGKLGDSCSLTEGPLCTTGLSCGVESFDGTNLVMKCMAEAASGAACKVSGPDMCPNGEFCAVPESMLEGTCTKLPAVGQPCAKGPFDAVPTICGPYARCEGGTCRALGSIGSTCTIDAVCLSETCVGGKCAPDGSCG